MTDRDNKEKMLVARQNLIMAFYDFWSWQYSRRNHRVIASCNRLKKLIITRNTKKAELSSDHIETVSALDHEIFQLAGNIFETTHFHYQDLLDVDVSSDTVLHDIANDTDYTLDALMGTGTRLYGTTGIFNKGLVTEQFVRALDPLTFWFDEIGLQCIVCDPFRPMDELLTDFKRIVSLEKCKRLGKHQFSGCKSTCEHGATCHYDGEPRADKIVKQILAKENVSFDPDKPEPRAVGLWLWDYTKAHSCSIAEAIRNLKSQHGNRLKQFGYADSDDAVFRRLRSNTDKCIDACEVQRV